MDVSFISGTTEELDRSAKDPDWAVEHVDELYDNNDSATPPRPSVDLDKAWAGLQFLFDEAEVELEFMMDGFVIVEEGTLFGWPVEELEPVARQLRATPWDQLAAHYDPEQMEKDDVYPRAWEADPDVRLEWLQNAYEELVAFFGEAADRGLGAFMNVSF